jgi:hypothetical protein
MRGWWRAEMYVRRSSSVLGCWAFIPDLKEVQFLLEM